MMDSQNEKHGLLGYEIRSSSEFFETKEDLATILAPRRSFRSRAWSLVLAILLTLTAFAYWVPSSLNSEHKVMPIKSIEHRVHEILSETPLIGQ